MQEHIDQNGKTYSLVFDSIQQFYDYIISTPLNDAFRWERHASSEKSYDRTKWTKTESFDQAAKLLKEGWTEMSQRLNIKLNTTYKLAPIAKRQTIQSVAGYQAIVPLYLAGVPTSMVNSKMVPVKQKVLNVTKLINYRCDITSDQIVEESTKALVVVKRLEAQGYRCNLYIGWGVSEHGGDSGRKVFVRIKVKSASEKLNISKVAFPLVHPSMLRRLCLRFEEVYPHMTKPFTCGYGYPVSYGKMKQVFNNDQIVLPSIWNVDPEKLDNLQNIQASV